jgi:hypothetical protein
MPTSNADIRPIYKRMMRSETVEVAPLNSLRTNLMPSGHGTRAAVVGAALSEISAFRSWGFPSVKALHFK